MHLIINLVFFTSFQFINLSHLALWVNNRRKWITVIFLNLCDNLLYYMICFCLLSLVFVFVFVFVSIFLTLTQSRYWHYEFVMHYHQELFLTLPFSFSITCTYYCLTTSQQTIKHYTDIFSLSLSLSLSLLSI